MSFFKDLYSASQRASRSQPGRTQSLQPADASPLAPAGHRRTRTEETPVPVSARLTPPIRKNSKELNKKLSKHSYSSSSLSNSLSSMVARLSPMQSYRKSAASKDSAGDNSSGRDVHLFSLDDLDAEQVSHEDIDDDPVFRGLRLACLRGLDVCRDLSVGKVVEVLIALGPEAYLERMGKSGGQADAVVMFDPDMLWGDFLAALGQANPERFLWICGVSTLSIDHCECDAAMKAVGRVEVVLPEWTSADALWTPENCRLARLDARFVVRATPRDENEFVLAVSHGSLPLGFFDALLVPVATVSPKLCRALKLWACNLLDMAAAKGQIDLGSKCLALGHVQCASKSFDEAIRYYEAAREADAGKAVAAVAEIGETLRRAGKLAQALAVFQHLIAQDAGEHGETLQAAALYMRMGDVFMDQAEFAAAEGAFQMCLTIYELHFGAHSESAAEGHCSLAKALSAQQLWPAARGHLEAALSIRKDLLQDSKAADALVSLGAVMVQEGNRMHALRKYTEATEICLNAHGPAHPATLECMFQAALVRLGLHDISEAIELLRAVVHKRLALFGLDDERTLAAMQNLGGAGGGGGGGEG
jgi:tetratricopeptide (TPR) repeat protein